MAQLIAVPIPRLLLFLDFIPNSFKTKFKYLTMVHDLLSDLTIGLLHSQNVRVRDMVRAVSLLPCSFCTSFPSQITKANTSYWQSMYFLYQLHW